MTLSYFEQCPRDQLNLRSTELEEKFLEKNLEVCFKICENFNI